MNLRFIALASLVAVGATANAVLVMDQLPRSSADMSLVSASQVFEPAFSNFTSVVIDDFTVNASQLGVTNVTAQMGGFNGFSDSHWTNANILRGFRVSIFGSVADAGDNISIATVDVALGDATIGAGFGVSFDRVVSLAVNLALPAAGTYWVGVQGLMDFTNNGQIGVFDSTWAGNNPGGANAFQANPGEGLGEGKTIPLNADAAYSVEAVPEPATMLALGAGAAALIARRRRKNV